jgi:hypothetical protein
MGSLTIAEQLKATQMKGNFVSDCEITLAVRDDTLDIVSDTYALSIQDDGTVDFYDMTNPSTPDLLEEFTFHEVCQILEEHLLETAHERSGQIG